MNDTPKTTLVERIEGKIDQQTMGELAIAGRGARVPAFQSMRDVMEFAKMMAVGGIAIPDHCRGQVGVCAAIIMQAQRWEMDCYAVASKSYVVNNRLAYESQLITAVINTRAPIKGRLRTRFSGEGNKRKCVASAIFIGDDVPTEVSSPEFGSIQPKNSPLWKSDPDQQLAYYTKRLWARRECPEVLLGVYDGDELDERGPDRARDVTPARPTRADFERGGDATSNPGSEQASSPSRTPGASDAAPGDTTAGGQPEPEGWEFVQPDGEIVVHADAKSWVDCFNAVLLGDAPDAMKDGAWETNSPMLARLRREAPNGEAAAQLVHDAQVAMLKRRDEAAAAARKPQEEREAAARTQTAPEASTASPAKAAGQEMPQAYRDKLIEYARRIARNSGTEALETWWQKQTPTPAAVLEAQRAELFALAVEADEHARKLQEAAER